ncbi:Xaa-Pro dipeptidase [Photobacterium aphoticum]|uniref:Xaa-Pro dipeptidase n=1 Tax=Photobacterium aphoticum TaxID=754436 RepID=A0A090QSR6_9GAMM|nr:Xaa-Pro dipeptidase [Photobacterium aphoticum]
MKNREDMTFAPEEYQARLTALRARIEERCLDAVVITDPENILYLTDYQTTGYSFFQALIVPLDQEPIMITRAMEESNVIERTWVEHSRPYPDTGDAIQMLVETCVNLTSVTSASAMSVTVTFSPLISRTSFTPR